MLSHCTSLHAHQWADKRASVFWEKVYLETSARTQIPSSLCVGLEVGGIPISPFSCGALGSPHKDFARGHHPSDRPITTITVPGRSQPPAILLLPQDCGFAPLSRALVAFSQPAPGSLLSHRSFLLWTHCLLRQAVGRPQQAVVPAVLPT